MNIKVENRTPFHRPIENGIKRSRLPNALASNQKGTVAFDRPGDRMHGGLDFRDGGTDCGFLRS
jgi:hypothetical protein